MGSSNVVFSNDAKAIVDVPFLRQDLQGCLWQNHELVYKRYH